MSFKFSDKKRQEGSYLIVDFLNLAFRWKHQGRSDFRFAIRDTVESLATSYKCKGIIITADQGSSSYRMAIHPEYKGNRKAMREKQTEADKMAFEEFIEEYEEALEVMAEKYPVLRFKGVEADDIAAHLVKWKDLYNLDKIWLISSDRDWDLLISESVSRFSYVTRKEVTFDTWAEHYDVPPESYISYKCLVGDTGDNVPGIKGIGPVKAKGLIEQYGTAMDIYDACPIDSKYKYMQELNDNAEVLLLNYELMDLITYCDEAIGADNIQLIGDKLL